MSEARYIDELVRQQWLIPLFPLVAAAIQSLLKRPQRKLSATLTIGAMGLSCIFALRAFFATLGGGVHAEVQRAIWNFTWFKFGTVGTSLDLGLILDPLTAGMAAMVSFVGFWIFVNAMGYMEEDENFTRFLLLSPVASVGEDADKTSVVFSLANQPGALFRALAALALRDIDLVKIESRPIEGQVWEYRFYIDFFGSTAEVRVQNALNHLRELSPDLRILGCYKRAERPQS